MAKRKSKFLLIWPPFLTSNILPLSVPCLAAYLKQKGVEDLEVLDLNVAYWKTMKPYWFLYRLLRRGYGILKKRGPAFLPVRNLMGRKMAKALEDMETEAKRFLPWSLKSILTSLGGDSWLPEREKIRALLKSVCVRDDVMFVGISVNFPDQLFFALLMARELKEKWGGMIRIIMGGAQITKNMDDLAKSRDVYRLVDFFVVGDGEEPLLRLLTEFPQENFSNIPNLYFKDPKAEGTYVYSGSSFCLDPNDFVIPDFSGFNRDVYYDSLPVIVSSGCPWGRCAFCSYAGVHGGKFCCGSVDKSMEILEGMKAKYGSSDFCFMDNALQAGFMGALAEKLIQRDMKISWISNIILNKEFANPDFCRLLKKSGLRWVGFGLEAVSRRVLKLMNKYHQNLEPEEIQRILTVIRGEGIDIGVYAFFGFPTETREEAQQTLDFLLENISLFDFINVYPFFLEDFTQVFREPEKFGITKIYKEDKEKLTGKRLTYSFEAKEGMSQAEADKFSREALWALRQAFIKKSRAKPSNPHSRA